MINRWGPHVLVLPEDDANRQIANGFYNHSAVNRARMKILQPPGGWPKVLQSLTDTQVSGLRTYTDRLLILIVDFDGVETRFSHVQAAIPEEFRNRVFILGSRTNPENAKRAMPGRHSFERIGRALAEDCVADTLSTWSQPELGCNLGELQRMRVTVRPCLFC